MIKRQLKLTPGIAGILRCVLMILIGSFFSCTEDGTGLKDDVVEKEDTEVEDRFNVYYDWSILSGDKYRYAGDAFEEDGKRYLFYCGNIDRPDRQLITDHIVMRSTSYEEDSWKYGEEQVVLWPGEEADDWDGLHVCDPTVVKGEFMYQRPDKNEAELFNYVLFYLGIAQGIYHGPERDIVNQIGFAVANNPSGPWYKVTTDHPLITSEAIGKWGVGQPSVINSDGWGELLLFYTRGEQKTATYARSIDLTDVNNPILSTEKELSINGFTEIDGSPDPLNHGGAFVKDSELNRYYIIRNTHPYPTDCPEWISSSVQIAYIDADELKNKNEIWTTVKNLGDSGSYPDRLFDPGWVRDPYGNLLDSEVLEVLVSTSRSGGSCPDGWLYSYRIQGYRIDK